MRALSRLSLPRRGAGYRRGHQRGVIAFELASYEDRHEQWEQPPWFEELSSDDLSQAPDSVEVWPNDQRLRDAEFLRALRARSESLRDLGLPWSVWAHWNVSDVWNEYQYARDSSSASGPPSRYGVYFLCVECGLRSCAYLYYWAKYEGALRDVFVRARAALGCTHAKPDLPEEETWEASAALVWLTNPALLTDLDDDD